MLVVRAHSNKVQPQSRETKEFGQRSDRGETGESVDFSMRLWDCVFNLPISQHAPLYPSWQEQTLLVEVPRVQTVTFVTRISDKCGHDPSQDSNTAFVLVLVCVPLDLHWWLQGPHLYQELTWHDGGGELAKEESCVVTGTVGVGLDSRVDLAITVEQQTTNHFNLPDSQKNKRR